MRILIATLPLLLAFGVGCTAETPANAPSNTAPAAAHAAPAPAEHAVDGDVWTCPMHPEVQAHEPGRCPECNMALVKAEDSPSPNGAGSMKTMDSHDHAHMSGEAGAKPAAKKEPAGSSHGSH